MNDQENRELWESNSPQNNKNKNNSRNPFSGIPRKGKNGKKRPFNYMSLIYMALLCVLAVVWFQGDGEGKNKEIAWNKLEQVLMNQDQEKIVVVNKEYAEIHVKENAILNDTLYNDISTTNAQGVKRPSGFYTYKFVTFESFEKDLDRVEEQIVARDTVGLADSTGVVAPEKLREIRNKANIELIPEQRTNAWREIIYLFGPLLMLVLFFWLMMRVSARQMGNSNGGDLFGMGKSRAKQYDANTDVKVTFADVAGLEGAKEEVMEVVDFLKNPQRYTNLGGKIPKGVLLVGPPGTGKTLLARAVAGEAGVPFFSMSGSEFVEMFVGMGAKRVRDLFDEAEKKAPCIIFIDEIDAVGRARGKGNFTGANDERESTLNQLLTKMDGFSTNKGVIVLAATNRADVLDKALLRAGRFDRQIYVELPDLEERQAIFEVHLRDKKVSDDVDREFLAKQTPGFSGADIANVCNEAALCAARKDKKAIEKQDFLDAVDRIIGGLEKRTKVMSDHEKHTIAYHESGHASVSWQLEWGDPLVKVTIVPRGKALGAAWYLPEERQITTFEQMFDSMTSLMAGRAAEEIVYGKISTGALNDIEHATKMAYSMVVYYGMSDKVGNVSFYDSTGQSEYSFGKPYSEKTAEEIDNEVKRLVEAAYERAKSIISNSRDKLEQLAQTLYEREVIFKDDVERIYGPRPWDEQKKEQQAIAEKSDDKPLDGAENEEIDNGDDTSSPLAESSEAVSNGTAEDHKPDSPSNQ